jgi:periplasmic divalent cation tolerance protein
MSREEVGTVVVFTTVPDDDLAVKIAQSLLEKRLAACVHILASGQSFYRWQGKIEHGAEKLMIIKSTVERYAELESTIRRLHPYDLPEIVSFPISHGLPAYLDWIRHETA